MAEINETTVNALVDEVNDLLDNEDRRSQSFITRGSGLAAFTGLIVPLVGLLGRAADVDLGSSMRLVVAFLFVVGTVLLLIAIAFVVFGVLMPSPGMTIRMSEVERYPSWAFISEPAVMAKGRQLRGLVNSLGVERTRNERKGRWLWAAYIVISVGLTCIATDGVILGLYEVL
jgi:hypothetical protein